MQKYFEDNNYRGPMAVVGVSFGLPGMDERQIEEMTTLSGGLVKFFGESKHISILSGTTDSMKKSSSMIKKAFAESDKTTHFGFDKGLDGYYGISPEGLAMMAQSILDRLTGAEDGLILLTIPMLTGHLTRNIRNTGHANLPLMNGMAHTVDKEGNHFVIAHGQIEPYHVK